MRLNVWSRDNGLPNGSTMVPPYGARRFDPAGAYSANVRIKNTTFAAFLGEKTMFENMKELTARAERLARAHRLPFDAAYDAWLEADTIDGAPDINRFMADGEDVLSEVLGADRYGAIRDAMARADRDQNWDVFDALSENEREVYGAYLTEFECGVK